MMLWFQHHSLITYLIILILAIYIYNKVFRVRKLPVLKELLIYLLIAAGSWILLFFQTHVGLPIVPSMLVAFCLMLIVRIRMMITERNSK